MLISNWIKLTSIALLILIASLIGYNKGKNAGEVKVALIAEQKAKIEAEYERRLSEKKVEIVTHYVDRWNVIKDKEIQYVQQALQDVPTQYVLSNSWVSLHNASARAEENISAANTDAKPSGITDTQALAVIVSNYSQYHQCTLQVKALQDIINEHNAIIDTVNNNSH